MKRTASRTRQSERIRQMVIAAMLSAVVALLTFTPIGMIPLPPPLLSATTVHVPVLVAALAEGPLVGMTVGLVFGLCSLIRAFQSPVGLTVFFLDPRVSVLPRILVPLAAWAVLALWRKAFRDGRVANRVGAALAAIVGTLTNTALCLGMIVLLHGAELTSLINQMISAGNAEAVYLDHAGAWLVAVVGVPNGIGECVVAAVLVPIILTAVEAVLRRSRRTAARRKEENA